MDKKIVSKIYKNHFGFPSTINWGHALFLCAIGTLIVYLIQKMIIKTDFLFESTSLVGNFIINSLLVIFALLLPVATLFIEKRNSPKNNMVDSVGSYTGLGVLILAFLSGIAMSLVSIPLHNLSAYIWLRLDKALIFPAFYFVNDATSKLEIWMSLFTKTIIPGFGISLFFTGLLWACFSKKNKKYAYVIIPLSFAVFSLNPTNFLSILALGLWICFLRDKTNNVFAPFLSILASGITEIFITKFISNIDISMVQVYSDIDATVLYSSVPAFIAGIILLAGFSKAFNDFSSSYFVEYGVDEKDENNVSLASGINLALITAFIIFLVLWIFVFKGVAS